MLTFVFVVVVEMVPALLFRPLRGTAITNGAQAGITSVVIAASCCAWPRALALLPEVIIGAATVALHRFAIRADGIFFRPEVFPYERRALPLPALPLPLRYTLSNSSSLISDMTEKRRGRLPPLW